MNQIDWLHDSNIRWPQHCFDKTMCLSATRHTVLCVACPLCSWTMHVFGTCLYGHSNRWIVQICFVRNERRKRLTHTHTPNYLAINELFVSLRFINGIWRMETRDVVFNDGADVEWPLWEMRIANKDENAYNLFNGAICTAGKCNAFLGNIPYSTLICVCVCMCEVQC